jgi:hypothetical protein
MDARVVAMPGGPLGHLDADGAIRWMLEQFRLLPLSAIRVGVHELWGPVCQSWYWLYSVPSTRSCRSLA